MGVPTAGGYGAAVARRRLPRVVRIGVLFGVAVFLLLQLVPYGRDHSNPPVTGEPEWPSEAARRLAVAACFDCHSNETEWPVYSWVAPMSWLVTRDVEDGRAALNFSTWPRDEHQLGDAADAVEDGEMPPRQYLLLHPDARLSAAEQRRLVEAFEAMDGDDADEDAIEDGTAEDGAPEDEGGRGRGRGRGRSGEGDDSEDAEPGSP